MNKSVELDVSALQQVEYSPGIDYRYFTAKECENHIIIDYVTKHAENIFKGKIVKTSINSDKYLNDIVYYNSNKFQRVPISKKYNQRDMLVIKPEFIIDEEKAKYIIENFKNVKYERIEDKPLWLAVGQAAWLMRNKGMTPWNAAKAAAGSVGRKHGVFINSKDVLSNMGKRGGRKSKK